MPRQRREWDSLSDTYRKRLERGGITRRDYERGRNLSAARGHYATPEHGLKSAKKNPKKYGEYIRKRAVPAEPVPPSVEDEAYELNSWKDRAFRNARNKLSDIYKYYEETVIANVYGGVTRESGEVKGMSLSEAKWSARATREQWREQASPQYRANPWWYH